MQNVQIPRFYVDLGQYLTAIGYDFGYDLNDDEMHLMSLNPAKQIEISDDTWNGILVPRVFPITYTAWLGHDAGSHMYPKWFDEDLAELSNVSDYSGINTQEYSDENPEYSGFTIATFTDSTEPYLGGIVGVGAKIGAVSIGNHFDMPSADLSLTLTYEYDGIDTLQSKGGASFSNALYTKPADWGNAGAWQLGSLPNSIPRSGRRVWDLQFSYVDSTKLMAKVAASSNVLATDGNDGSGYEVADYPRENTLLDGDDFFSSVWNLTLGGHLKFIFNPSGGGTSPNNNPDQFAICKFDMGSLKYTQVAHSVYNVKLKIREVW